VLATLVHGLVDNSIFVPDLAVAFWLALALTSVVGSQYPVASHVGSTAVVADSVADGRDRLASIGSSARRGTRSY
jgi:hypothetical protein